MARKKSRTTTPELENIPEVDLIADEEHPDFIGGSIGDDSEAADLAGYDAEALDAFTPIPGGPIPQPLPRPLPQPLPQPIPRPIPHLPTQPVPTIPRPVPWRICSAVSGRYRYVPQPVLTQPAPGPIAPRPRPYIPGPIFPVNLLTIRVRVDVDRYTPQNRVSIEVNRLFPRSTAHAIAEVTSDQCLSYNNRRILANITYRDGNASLIPGTTVEFRASRTTGFGYGKYTLTLSGGGIVAKTYALAFESPYFDSVEFEVDRVANADTPTTTYNTGSHPTRPSNLPIETLSFATIFKRAGFDARMSPNTSVIPTSGAGANGTWSDAEMHNAMVTYWSRFANRPNWAMWVLFAKRHDRGRGLGGIMFDDIGPNHRQGTAIFTDSFIQDVPFGDPNPATFRQRNVFWTAVHEIGHGFNLAHSWQKAVGDPWGNPWIPLANEPEARSFMNYPRSVAGGENAFWADFRFRFSDTELTFMRHAPRRFVQMGNSDWFENHAFEAPDAMLQTGAWKLEIRPNRAENAYRFLEPVYMELKLTNTSTQDAQVEDDMLRDGRHINVYVQREGGQTKDWKAMVTSCHAPHSDTLKPGGSIYGSHNISTSTDGWIIDEPGFYKVQAAVDMGDEVVVSNVLRLYVMPSGSAEEARVAPDYFSEDVGRAMTFKGAPALDGAMAVLKAVSERCADNPAAKIASLALSTPLLRAFKSLAAGDSRDDMKIQASRPDIDTGAKAQMGVLIDDADAAADTLGHIAYFNQLEVLAEAMEDAGDDKGSIKVREATVKTMRRRNILGAIIDLAERRLARRKK